MLLNVDGLDESVMSASSICGLADVYTRGDPVIPSGTFWDCSDLAQTWFQNDPFSVTYGEEKNFIAPQPFSGESSPTRFACQEPFSTEPSVLKQSNFDDDSWSPFLSPGLSSPVDESCADFLLVQGTEKGNMPPLSNLNDFPGFSDLPSIWADSPLAKFGTHSPGERNLGTPGGTPELSHSPASMRPPTPPRPGQRKGLLLGWGEATHLHTSTPVSSALRPRSLSPSPDVDAVDPQTLCGSPLRKRPRQPTISDDGSPTVKSEVSSPDFTDGDASLDDSESDDYRPSSSPSSKFARFKTKPSADATPSPKSSFMRRGKIVKSKRKGSAALALAVVTQMGNAKREAETLQVPLDPESLDPVRVYREGNYVVKKRKNQPIPIPIPVPNLNKMSRGRKVPFTLGSESPVPSSISTPSIGQVRSSARARKKALTPSASDESGGGRSFVCIVPGCGKCFVRGEHLKRHVRSIHTHEKPHVCPIEGCDKSFSRRDNLGQHVRVHLQP